MIETRPRTRWKRLVVLACALLLCGAYGIIAWGSDSIIWPADAYAAYREHRASQKRFAAKYAAATPFNASDGGGYIGLPGTTIWAKVPQDATGTRFNAASNGFFGLKPCVEWAQAPRLRVQVTTIDAIRRGPVPEPTTDEGLVWWMDVRETIEEVVAEGDTTHRYSYEVPSRTGSHRRIDVDLEFGAVVILFWSDKYPEPPDMPEFFAIGDPVPPDGE